MIAYFDCYSGVAGDMLVGSMLDAGLPFSYLKNELKKLHLHGYMLQKKVDRRGVIGGTKFIVAINQQQHHHTSYKEILKMIQSSRLSKNTKILSKEIFYTLAKAEAKVHRSRINDVHFHEVGAVDSIVDIVGASIGLDYFKFERIYSSPLPITRGFIKCEHGMMPVPAPATLEILKDVPLTKAPVKDEIVTPTGAAILKTIANKFGESPIRDIKKIGYGLGDKKLNEIPNALRLITGIGNELIVIETNIDDMNPQFYGYLIEKLLASGAIDVTVLPAFMKKRRPAAVIQVICPSDDRKIITELLLKETTTFGARFYPIERKILERKFEVINTKFGKIHAKAGFLNGKRIKLVPEYEDCLKLAARHKVPLSKIYESVPKY
jgi:uncharacterized protein (TIGR00299 family) protein